MHVLHRLASLCKARGVLFKQVFFAGGPIEDRIGQSVPGHFWTGMCRKMKRRICQFIIFGWWFQTFFVFHNIWDNLSH